MRNAALLFIFIFLPSTVLADTLILRSGKEKSGTILEETDDHVLFDSKSDGRVMEVKRGDISIVDREVSDSEEEGALNFFSTPPPQKKKKNTLPAKPAKKETLEGFEVRRTEKRKDDAQEKIDESGFFKMLETYLEDWKRKNPESSKWFNDLMHSFKGKSDEFEKAIEAAKKG